MSDILFRGKRVKPVTLVSQWIYGNYVFKADNSLPGLNKHFIVVHDGFGLSQWIEVEPATIGQYTGLKDKNGRMIFEGDIVDCWSEGVNAKGTVQQRKDGLWIIYPAWQKTIMWGLCPDGYCNTTVEVIGNIHDNGELIHEK